MQTLVFNTTTKTVLVKAVDSTILYEFNEIPTVKIESGYYEVIQIDSAFADGRKIPVARFPIANTNMLIKK